MLSFLSLRSWNLCLFCYKILRKHPLTYFPIKIWWQCAGACLFKEMTPAICHWGVVMDFLACFVFSFCFFCPCIPYLDLCFCTKIIVLFVYNIQYFINHCYLWNFWVWCDVILPSHSKLCICHFAVLPVILSADRQADTLFLQYMVRRS